MRRKIRVHQNWFFPLSQKEGHFDGIFGKRAKRYLVIAVCIIAGGRKTADGLRAHDIKQKLLSDVRSEQLTTIPWMGEQVKIRLYCQSVLFTGLPGHQVFNFIHVFISIPRDSGFHLETRSEFVPGGR